MTPEADGARMVERERSRDRALAGDPEVVRLRSRLRELLDAASLARHEAEDVSYLLDQATARVFREAGLA